MGKQDEGMSRVTTAPHDGVVRITLPANVAFNMGRLTEVLGGIAERLGCRPCFSGAACLILTERNFVVDPELRIHGVASSDPMPIVPAGGFVSKL